jgi:two-component system chemotaxis sensor kinase CheA
MSLQTQQQLAESAVTVVQDHQETDQLLLCESGPGRRIAIPLAQVTRLEEFSKRVIEHAADREVVQYRGEILPLVRLPTNLGRSSDANDSIQVVVSEHNGRLVGVVVDKILDVVSGTSEVDATCDEGKRPRVAESIVIDQRVTDLVDLENLVRTVNAIAG